MREKRRLRVFKNRVLRRKCGTKRDVLARKWRKLHNAKPNDLYYYYYQSETARERKRERESEKDSETMSKEWKYKSTYCFFNNGVQSIVCELRL